MVTKYDRRGYRPRRRPFIITSEAVYLLNEKDFRLKLKIPFSNLTSTLRYLLLYLILADDLGLGTTSDHMGTDHVELEPVAYLEIGKWGRGYISGVYFQKKC